ncbi:MAG: O-acetylserine/cysteine export protein [Methanomassiliicoccales archaeon PtaU1.Bin124]|nr:MAG: O-acetylserine/cysteine export protein [Methanomassiliicoccales archaeon PtaU1.Bin124]
MQGIPGCPYISPHDTVALTERKLGAELPLVISGVIWGSSFVTSKIGVEHMDPVLFSFLRYLFASLSIIPILIFFKRFDRKVLTNKYIIAISILNAVAMALQNISMTMTTSTNAVLLININIVFIALLAVLILKEVLTRRTIAGLLLGMFGAFIITTNGSFDSLAGGNVLGNMIALISGLLWAFYVIYLTKALHSGVDEVSATLVTILYTMLALLPLSIVVQPSYAVDATAIGMAIYGGIMCTTVAFLLYNYGLRVLGATTASVILLTEMVFGMFFSIIFLNEIPTVAIAIGAGLILIAVWIMSMKKKDGAVARPKIHE